MDCVFRLLEVSHTDGEIIAVLPLSRVLGQEASLMLQADFRLLAQQADCSVELDLQQVAFIDGSFLARLLEHHRELSARSIRLTARLSPAIAKVAAITKLDRCRNVKESSANQPFDRASP